jgi:hypothetical protein
MSTYQICAGFGLELVACEPLIIQLERDLI